MEALKHFWRVLISSQQCHQKVALLCACRPALFCRNEATASMSSRLHECKAGVSATFLHADAAIL